MKNRFYPPFVMLTLSVCALSCDDYDDSDIKYDIAELQEAVADLQDQVDEMNSSVATLQTIASALSSADLVTSVTSITQDGEVIGYSITFMNSGTIFIYNGSDGVNGTDGEKGDTPVIGIKADDDGVYYWTCDGEWLLDENGDKIKAGAEDGVTPQLKIEDGYWYVSYDEGSTWVYLGTASDTASTTSYITGMEQDDEYVYLTLADGTVLTLSKKEVLGVTLDVSEASFTEAGETLEVAYTLTGTDDDTFIRVLGTEGYSAEVSKIDNSSGTISITAPDPLTEGEVWVFVANEETTLMRIISAIPGNILIVSDETYTISSEGGELEIGVSASVEYSVEIPEDVDWIVYTETKAIRSETVVLTIEESTDTDSRYACVSLVNTADDTQTVSVLITQEGTFPSEGGVTFPVEFPVSKVDGVQRFTATTQPDWVSDGIWWNDSQPQAYATWNQVSDIDETSGYNQFRETVNNGNVSSPGVKGIWTGDYWEYVIPVEDFKANTTIKIEFPIYGRQEPVFWYIKYLDGDDWQIVNYHTVTCYDEETSMECTFSMNRGATVINETMTFENAIEKGFVKIRVECADGSIVASASSSVNTLSYPYASNGVYAAPYYFWDQSGTSATPETTAVTISVVEDTTD